MRLSPAEWTGVAAGVLLAGGGVAYAIWKSGAADTGESIDVTSTDEEPTEPQGPAALAADAGATLPVYALARAIASESGGSAYPAQVAVGWTIRNYSDAHYHGDVVKAILGSAAFFGGQGSGGRHYVSTARAPLGSQLKLAAQIIAGDIGDSTGGATNFDSPREQAREHAENPAIKTPEQVAAERIRSGLVAYDVDVAGADFRFWGPA